MMECKVFDSIIGYAEVKLELMRILDQLRYPEKYTALGVSDTHGLLLHGGVIWKISKQKAYAQCAVKNWTNGI